MESSPTRVWVKLVAIFQIIISIGFLVVAIYGFSNLHQIRLRFSEYENLSGSEKLEVKVKNGTRNGTLTELSQEYNEVTEELIYEIARGFTALFIMLLGVAMGILLLKGLQGDDERKLQVWIFLTALCVMLGFTQLVVNYYATPTPELGSSFIAINIILLVYLGSIGIVNSHRQRLLLQEQQQKQLQLQQKLQNNGIV